MKIQKFHHRKRLIVIIASILGLVAILGIAGYTLLSDSSNKASKSIEVQQKLVVDGMADVRSKLSDTNLSVDDKSKIITDYSDILNSSVDNVCKEQLKLIYFVYSSEYSRCHDLIDSLTKLRNTAVELKEFLNDDKLLSSIIPPVSNDLTYQQSYDLWSNALNAVDALTVNDNVNATKIALQDAITVYKGAWKALVDADANKDKDAFIRAKDNLSVSYSTLIHVSDTQTKSLTEIQDKFNTNYQSFLVQTD